MVRLAEEKDLIGILELYLSLHENSVPKDSKKRRAMKVTDTQERVLNTQSRLL